ncbi:MAG TPA: gamma-glutamyltransferase [Terriglobales bacterium]|nr:gamma-glutamyltransferase [Terriglobales bacterium]
MRPRRGSARVVIALRLRPQQQPWFPESALPIAERLSLIAQNRITIPQREVPMICRRTLLVLFAFVATFSFTQQSEQAEPLTGKTMRPIIRGRHAAVSSMKQEATAAAIRILQAGGNAFDAAVAGQAALAVTDFSLNGVGSDAELLIYSARDHQVYSINAEPKAPTLATIAWYQQNNGGKIPSSDGLLSGGIPGVVDAWYILLDRWGTMSFEQVLQPALELAEQGFPISEAGAHAIAVSKKILKYPSTTRIYLPNGRAPQPGEIFKNPDLAATLKKLIEAEKATKSRGRHAALQAARDRFYKGDIAQELARFSEANGGLFRYQDFAEYTAEVETPIHINYHDYEIYKNPSASQGPTELFALNMLEGYDLKKLGHNSPDFIHTSVEAMKLAMADREKYLGDADFIKIPYDTLLSKQYAGNRRALIDEQRASLDLRPGVIGGSSSPVPTTTEGHASHTGDTSYIALVDQAHNFVSFEPSLHSVFGTGVVMGNTGIIFNCRGDYYSLVPGEANALAPGKRPRSTLQSTLVMRDGKPYMIMGSPGGDDQVMRTMQTLINIIDFGMNIQEAIEAPRWTTRSFPASPFPHTMYPGDLGLESRIPEATREALAARGHKVRVTGPWTMGSNAVIMLDWETGVLSAGADPRVEAYAWAY